MIVQVPESDLARFGITNLLEPVLWSYAEDLDMYLPRSTWLALKVLFPFLPLFIIISSHSDESGEVQPGRGQTARDDIIPTQCIISVTMSRGWNSSPGSTKSSKSSRG